MSSDCVSGKNTAVSWSMYKRQDLVSLIDECKKKECTMYHDKVYSLLAICGQGSDAQVIVDLTRELLAK
jgi:hypothetical protein